MTDSGNLHEAFEVVWMAADDQHPSLFYSSPQTPLKAIHSQPE